MQDENLSQADFDLSKIVNLEEVKALLDYFYKITGAGSAVLDLKGNILIGVGWQDICTKFHRINPESNKSCIESDIFLTKNCLKGQSLAYKCKNHLTDIVIPLYVNDKHIANVFTGQFFTEDSQIETEKFIEQAEKYGFDKDAYLSALERVPLFSKEKIDNIILFLEKLTHFISVISLNNLKLQKEVEERKRIESELEKANQQYKSLVDNVNIGISLISPDMKILTLNKCMQTWFPDIDTALTPICYKAFNNPPREDICTYCPTYKTLQDGKVHESIAETPVEGGIISYRVMSSPVIDKQGKILAATEIVEDITEKIKHEKEFSDKVKQLETMNKMMIGRELKMVQMKNEINKLSEELGRPHPYKYTNKE